MSLEQRIERLEKVVALMGERNQFYKIEVEDPTNFDEQNKILSELDTILDTIREEHTKK